jgi:hypothetical protein
MRIQKAIIAVLVVLTTAVLIIQCKSKKSEETPGVSKITPKELPSIVPGFTFPEDSNTVLGWLSPYDSTSVYNHAWGVWAGLTANSGELYQGDSLLIYQTWLGIGDIQAIVASGGREKAAQLTKTGRTPLTVPNQLLHARKFAALQGHAVDTSAGFNTSGFNFWVSVSYDPNAAEHVISHSLLKQSVLDSYLKPGGIGSIPPFPPKAITTKPVYFVGHRRDSLVRIPAWPGPPSTPQAYDADIWNNYVYADIQNRQQPGKKLVPVTTDKPSSAQIAAATCNLSDFINFKIDAAMAKYFNEQQSAVQGDTAVAGDIAILVAMHVTTKEISNWTWQTFYWAPNPGTPYSPSSVLAASLRPSQLQGAASHYALSTAYAEVLPNQPVTGGTNTGVTAMIGYNPYLEATFGPAVFAGFPQSFNPAYQYGIQTNCMSCHALATAQPTPYTTDQYVDMADTIFINTVQLDFAWSIQAAIIPDSASATK